LPPPPRSPRAARAHCAGAPWARWPRRGRRPAPAAPAARAAEPHALRGRTGGQGAPCCRRPGRRGSRRTRGRPGTRSRAVQAARPRAQRRPRWRAPVQRRSRPPPPRTASRRAPCRAAGAAHFDADLLPRPRPCGCMLWQHGRPGEHAVSHARAGGCREAGTGAAGRRERRSAVGRDGACDRRRGAVARPGGLSGDCHAPKRAGCRTASAHVRPPHCRLSCTLRSSAAKTASDLPCSVPCTSCSMLCRSALLRSYVVPHQPCREPPVRQASERRVMRAAST